jgi:hypothetical protein
MKKEQKLKDEPIPTHKLPKHTVDFEVFEWLK